MLAVAETGNALGAELWRIMRSVRTNPTRLARESGVSRATINAILSGDQPNPTSETLTKLARALATGPAGDIDQNQARSYAGSMARALAAPGDSDDPLEAALAERFPNLQAERLLALAQDMNDSGMTPEEQEGLLLTWRIPRDVIRLVLDRFAAPNRN